jgi:dTMP kinase
VSVEGLSGTGKSYLARRLAERLDNPLLVEEFSRRRHRRDDLGSRIVTALADAARGDHFLRAGRPNSETLLLLAVQMHTWESVQPALAAGRTVLEGRSVHSVAVYQAATLHPHDDAAALRCATRILAEAAVWRPLPDLVLLLTDDTATALARAEQRDQRRFTPAERTVHARCAALFEELAGADPDRVRQIDRRRTPDAATAIDLMATWIHQTPPRPRLPKGVPA